MLLEVFCKKDYICNGIPTLHQLKRNNLKTPRACHIMLSFRINLAVFLPCNCILFIFKEIGALHLGEVQDLTQQTAPHHLMIPFNKHLKPLSHLSPLHQLLPLSLHPFSSIPRLHHLRHKCLLQKTLVLQVQLDHHQV